MLLESGAVRQKTAKRDGDAGLRDRDGKVDIAVDVAIKVEPARVHELHHRNGGEELRDRSRSHQSCICAEWPPGSDIGEAIALGENEAIALDHDDHRTRAFALVDPI